MRKHCPECQHPIIEVAWADMDDAVRQRICNERGTGRPLPAHIYLCNRCNTMWIPQPTPNCR